MPRLLRGSLGGGGPPDCPPDGRSRRVTLLLDQDVPDAIGRVAAQEGHTVTRLREVLPPDADDSAVLRFAHSHQSVLVTCNRDHFLALVADHPHAGLIVVDRKSTRLN